jgi:hypothetical protein
VVTGLDPYLVSCGGDAIEIALLYEGAGAGKGAVSGGPIVFDGKRQMSCRRIKKKEAHSPNYRVSRS